MWPLIGPALTTMQYVMYNSGFADDTMFSNNIFIYVHQTGSNINNDNNNRKLNYKQLSITTCCKIGKHHSL